jgi:hypothetical protein
MTNAEDITGGKSIKGNLQRLSDAELLREAARQLEIASIQITSRVEQVAALLPDKPK